MDGEIMRPENTKIRIYEAVEGYIQNLKEYNEKAGYNNFSLTLIKKYGCSEGMIKTAFSKYGFEIKEDMAVKIK